MANSAQWFGFGPSIVYYPRILCFEKKSSSQLEKGVELRVLERQESQGGWSLTVLTDVQWKRLGKVELQNYHSHVNQNDPSP